MICIDRLIHILTLLILLPGAGVSLCYAQHEKQTFRPKMLVYENLKNEDVLKHFQKRFAQLDTLLKNQVTVASPTAQLGYIDRSISAYTDSLYGAKTAHETLAFNRHTGLEITGQTYMRPDEALKNVDEEDNVSVYKAKAQAELGWNIINSRFYQGKAKREKIALANELARLQQKKRLATDSYDKAAERITDQYNRYIGITIAHRLENLDIMNEAYQFMLEKDRISNDKMLKVMNDKMEAEYDLSILCASKDIDGQPVYRIVPTRIDVDTTTLWKYVTQESMDARISNVKVQMADNESGRKKKALATEKEIIRNTRTSDVATLKQECETLVKKVENINRAIATEAFHITQMGKYVAMRRYAYKNQKTGYNYLARMEEYTGYLESMERMYKLMQNRALAIINIQKIAGLNNNTKGIFLETEL